MSITIGDYTADGPYSSMEDLKDKSGVYIILGRNTGDKQWNVVDVGESSEVKTRVENHDRESCWEDEGYDEIECAVIYTGELDRTKIEKELRDKYDPPCGVR